MLERELLEMGVTKELLPNHPDVYRVSAPDGYSFVSKDGVNYGPVVYSGKSLGNRYNLKKDKNYEEIINNITNTDNNNG